MLIEHNVALRRNDAVDRVRAVRDQQAMARFEQSAGIREKSFGALDRTDVDHVDVEDVVKVSGQLGEIAVRVAVQIGAARRTVASPFRVRSLDVDEHGRTDVARRALGRVGGAAGQHAAVELGRLECYVGEMGRKVGDMLAGAGCRVEGAQIRFGGAEQRAEHIENGRRVALRRMVGHFVRTAAGMGGVLRVSSRQWYLGIGARSTQKVCERGQVNAIG